MRNLMIVIMVLGSVSLTIAQNFGIDTPTPAEKLDVNGNIALRGIKLAAFLKNPLTGGGDLRWESNELSWTERIIALPAGDAGSEHLNTAPWQPGPQSVTIGAWSVAYMRPSDADLSANGGSYNPIQVAGYGSYDPEIGDVIVAVHNGDNGMLYTSFGVVMPPNSTFTRDGVLIRSGGAGAGSYSNPLTSTSQADALGLSSGNYYFNFPGSAGMSELYYQSNLSDGFGFVRVFSSPYNGVATVNFVGRSFPWTKFLVQTMDGFTAKATAYFSSTRLFNTDNSTATASSGNRAGYRVYIGGPGSMGIYNTSQLPCNWGNSSGSVGAGYNGSCGSFPNGLIWGVGTTSANYTTIVAVWEVWIAN